VTTGLGVVVVTYDSGDVLGGFLDSLRHSTVLPDEVIVVDNSPHALTPPKTPWLDSLRVIHRPDNPGYGAAANSGVAALGSSIHHVVVCNPDIVVRPETLATLLDHAINYPTAGALGPGIVNEDGSLYPSARALPTLGIGIGHALLGIFWPTNPWTRAYRGDYRSETPRVTGWLSGAFLLLNRKAFESVEGFDEGYFMFFEDVDLGWRLSDAGYPNWYVPAASATHIGGTSTRKNHQAMLTAHHDSALRFISKRYPGPLWWPLRTLIGVGLTLRERLLRQRALDLRG
jgi:N-acetylglucosaminyl-diphospho-decaprenol L-rhamnosyltransferase